MVAHHSLYSIRYVLKSNSQTNTYTHNKTFFNSYGVVVCMPKQATTTVQMDKEGRVVIPAQTRRALGINKENADLELTVTVLNDD